VVVAAQVQHDLHGRGPIASPRARVALVWASGNWRTGGQARGGGQLSFNPFSLSQRHRINLRVQRNPVCHRYGWTTARSPILITRRQQRLMPADQFNDTVGRCMPRRCVPCCGRAPKPTGKDDDLTCGQRAKRKAGESSTPTSSGSSSQKNARTSEKVRVDSHTAEREDARTRARV